MQKSCFAFLFSLFFLVSAFAQEGIIGEIRLFAGNFEPRNWAYCDGRLLQISQNQALFSILGTQYGGNGTSTFGLPNLEGPIIPASNGIVPATRSDRSRQQIEVEFENDSPYELKVEWLDTDGKAIDYGVLKPGNTLTQNTSPGSVWQFLIDGVIVRRLKTTPDLKQDYTIRPPQRVKYIICIQGIFPSRN